MWTRRALVAADRGFLVALEVALRWAALPPGLRETLADQQVTARLAGWDGRGAAAEVVCVGDAPVAVYVSRDDGDDRDLVQLDVLPAHQSRGLCTWLLRGEQRLVAARGGAARLRVARDNDRARALYTRLGWVPVDDDGTSLYVAMCWRSDP